MQYTNKGGGTSRRKFNIISERKRRKIEEMENDQTTFHFFQQRGPFFQTWNCVIQSKILQNAKEDNEFSPSETDRCLNMAVRDETIMFLFVHTRNIV